MSSGSLALILHAHLPFVRHPEHEHFLEEEWLFEAITETYIPLIQMMQQLVRDGVPFKLTMSITPTLCAMLSDSVLRKRYLNHLDLLIHLTARERHRNRNSPELAELSEFYFDTFSERRRVFAGAWKRDLLGQFRALRDQGVLEIIGCAATHGLLPLLLQQSMETARAQVLIGCDEYRKSFGANPAGFWLPECAYSRGVDTILQEANIRWFVLDTHGLMFADPRPRHAVYAPCYTPPGPAVFARDRETSRQVWSAQSGYPGDVMYRDFYRDIGFDLPFEELGPIARGLRKFTGVKYYRITGRTPKKELYDRHAAEKTVNAHAAHYLEQRCRQLAGIAANGFEPIITAPFDAELFGHWWFEGIQFLEAFIRKASSEDISLTSPTDYLGAHPTQQTVAPAASTWGDEGHLQVWLDPSTSWIYAPLHAVGQKMTELARANAEKPSRLPGRVLTQLGRELLLAQSSDWAFLIRNGTAREYATQRTVDHLRRFDRLHREYLAGQIDEAFLSECETRHNLFPDVNWRYYA